MKFQTFSSTTLYDLNERMSVVMEALVKSGRRIVAVTTAVEYAYATIEMWYGTIFHEEKT